MGYTRRKTVSKKTTSNYGRRRNYKKGSLKNRRKMTIKNGGGLARDICNVASKVIIPKCFSRFNFYQTDSVAKTKSKLERMNNPETPDKFRRYMERSWEDYVGTEGYINFFDKMPDMEDVYRFLESDGYETIESKLETMIDPRTAPNIRRYMKSKWEKYKGSEGYYSFLDNTLLYNFFTWDTDEEQKEKNERINNFNIPEDIRFYMIRQQGQMLDEEPNDDPVTPQYPGVGDYHSDND
jgi:hypothetical protein